VRLVGLIPLAVIGGGLAEIDPKAPLYSRLLASVRGNIPASSGTVGGRYRLTATAPRRFQHPYQSQRFELWRYNDRAMTMAT